MKKAVKIVIIGSGASGIGSAVKLIENGFKDVLILEANDRIGGRINSIQFGSKGSFIDLGAQWISGENCVYDLMKDFFEFGETGNASENKKYFTSNGSEEVDKAKIVKLLKLNEELFLNTEELKKSDEMYGDYFTRKYFEAMKLPEYDDISHELCSQMLIHHQNEFNAIYASTNWNEVPAKVVAEVVFVEGSQLMTWKRSGYKTLLEFLMKKVQTTQHVNLNERIVFNKKAINIDWSSSKALIKCEDGSEYSADHVVTTIPHGVIKARHETLFTPALPSEKIQAIQSVEFGTLGKIFFEFEKKFFPEGVQSYVVLWTEMDLKDVRGTDKEWLVDVYSFMHVDSYENLVEALVAGKHMKEFETYDDKKVIDDCMWLLEKFLKKPITPPINIRRTKWKTDDNFLGSYAYPSIKTTASSIEQLGKSIFDEDSKPIVLFGGEVTSSKHQGYVHGALEAGLRVADELIEYYRLKHC